MPPRHGAFSVGAPRSRLDPRHDFRGIVRCPIFFQDAEGCDDEPLDRFTRVDRFLMTCERSARKQVAEVAVQPAQIRLRESARRRRSGGNLRPLIATSVQAACFHEATSCSMSLETGAMRKQAARRLADCARRIRELGQNRCRASRTTIDRAVRHRNRGHRLGEARQVEEGVGPARPRKYRARRPWQSRPLHVGAT